MYTKVVSIWAGHVVFWLELGCWLIELGAGSDEILLGVETLRGL